VPGAKLADLDRKNLQLSFDTKVIGPTMLAKHLAQQMNPGGSFVLFSGVHAFKLNVGYLGVGITNGAVDFLTRWLAVELAPIRVNAISPGVIDTGAWDAMGEDGKRSYFEHISSSNPARRIGTTEDVSGAVLFAMTNSFMTGVTLKIDGGEPLT
jgi:NAD(P)-dependent dehydrogenase (short-subunit alcohol dehydrogenase family)